MQFNVDVSILIAVGAAAVIIVAEVIRVIRGEKANKELQQHITDERNKADDYTHKRGKDVIAAVKSIQTQLEMIDKYWRDKVDNIDSRNRDKADDMQETLKEINSLLIEVIKHL